MNWITARLPSRSATLGSFTAVTIAALAAFAGHGAARADDASAAGLSAICTDRPTKADYACTVEEGHFQYESDLVYGAFSGFHGDTVDTWLVPNVTFKYGVSGTMDLELNLAPLAIVHTHEQGADSTLTGIGDLYLRAKYRFLGSNDSIWSASVVPYVKVPTAKTGIGNGAVEGGLNVPFNYKPSDAVTVTTVPEVDVLADAAGAGHHLYTAQVLNVAYAVTKKTVAYAELWGSWNFDPAGTAHQGSADVAIAYLITDLLQCDAGLNVGLNRETPELQGYIGLSQKF
jgi:hypothetical protein